MEEQLNILRECHDDNGHKGVTSVIKTIGSRYYWPSWTLHVTDYCLSCQQCQQSNITLKQQPVGELHPIPVIKDLWRQWGIDYIGPFAETVSGNRYIIAATDYFSKWPEAMAVAKNDAQTTAKFLHSLYCRYGAADVLISDRGSHFCNKVMEEMNTYFGVKHKVSTPYHPQTNGLQERTNQTIERALQKLKQDTNNWDIHLEAALFGIRQANSNVTKSSPYEIAFGREPTLPSELNLKESISPNQATEALVNNLNNFRQKLQDSVNENIKTAQCRMKEAQQRKVTTRLKFKPGDIVYRRNCRKLQRKQSKLKELNWIGPYTIDSISKSGVAVLKDKTGSRLKTKCSTANLKLQRKRPGHLQTKRKPERVTIATGTDPTQATRNLHQQTVNTTDQPLREESQTLLGPKASEKSNTATIKKSLRGKRKHAQEDSNTTESTQVKRDKIRNQQESTGNKEPSCEMSFLTDAKEDIQQRIVEFLQTDLVAAIQTSLMKKKMPSITSPSQMPVCNSDLRLSMIKDMNNKDEEAFDFIFDQVIQEISGKDLGEKTSVAMLSSAVILASCIKRMPLVEIMDTIKEDPSHLQKIGIRPTGKLPASKRLVIANNSIYAKDLLCLDGEEWLDDTVIHAYLGLLQKERSQQQKNEVYVLPCFLHEKWVQRDYLGWLFPNVKLATYSFIIMPICRHHHWMLLVADVRNRTLSILDSLGGDHPDIENKWRKYMFTRERYFPEGLEKWVSLNHHVNLQKDGNSCGIFILMFAEAIVSGTNPGIMQQGHVKRYRLYVKQRLTEGSTEDEEVCQIPFCVKPKKAVWTRCQDCGLWVHLQCSNIKGRKVTADHVCIICLWRQESKLSS
ncbi:uncharacterized protein LOC133196670 [Saccostrea echinata]|uniref:uncharacterized protein LOC133196670 n=1 Tax=Saccostrea echinata TaxID=191078 RepID=UPI002A7F8D46|nr:uncharacterized protein LOC133196670 [Saccostrea echinata]